jgi:hypothetical protein
VKQGHGTTNDGNTARRFFTNFELSAEITGIHPDFINRFAVMLQAISFRQLILAFLGNIAEKQQYCILTYTHGITCLQVYIHKLLLHGADICESFSFIPIGMLSEEASEARNKDF